MTLCSARELVPPSSLYQSQKDQLSTLAEMERHHIEWVLEATGGNRTHTAKILGIGLRTLQRKLRLFPESTTGRK
ncbi:MAG: helix-turn-helix domain-containing protein [Desulfatiglandales bacterium]